MPASRRAGHYSLLGALLIFTALMAPAGDRGGAAHRHRMNCRHRARNRHPAGASFRFAVAAGRFYPLAGALVALVRWARAPLLAAIGL